MPVANHAPTTVGKNQLGIRGQECSNSASTAGNVSGRPPGYAGVAVAV